MKQQMLEAELVREKAYVVRLEKMIHHRNLDITAKTATIHRQSREMTAMALEIEVLKAKVNPKPLPGGYPIPSASQLRDRANSPA